MLEPHVIDFIDGELSYRLDYPAEHCERYFGAPREWTERKRLTRDGARAAWWLSARALIHRSSWGNGGVGARLAALLRTTPVALFGSAPLRAAAAVSYTLAKARCRVWRLSEGRLLRAYRDAWERLGRRTRLRGVETLPVELGAPDDSPPFALAEMPDQQLFGFHPREQSNGTRFRWSQSVAFADVPVEPGAYRVEIDTGGLRDPRALDVQLFFNGGRVPPERVELDPRLIRFVVGPQQFAHGSDQRLGLAVRPFVPARVADSPDERELGLPVLAVSFEPLGDGAG
jgi:hypothetical protein